MRVVYDCRYVRVGRHDGISRYTAGVVGELQHLVDLVVLISDERQLEMLPAGIRWRRVSGPTSVLEPLVALQVNRLRPDVVITPMQTMGTAFRRYRVALTVHDLIYYSNPEPPHDLPGFVRVLWRLYHKAWWPQRMLLNGGDAVVTVSHTTEGLIAQHDLTRRPVVVARNAADLPDPSLVATDPDAQAGARSIVYMGSFMPYKNVETLARTAELLPEYTLHLLSRSTPADEQRLRDAAPRARLVFHRGVSDEEYHELLRRSTALVTASLDEGFGIPLVESMGYGTPVVVSDIPVFEEIGGEAALYAPATDPAAFAERIRSLEDPAEWRRRSTLSRAQAERFSWAESARAIAGLAGELTRRARSR
ncbi:glycosyl transferase family 1 [Cnuibacter physcomitrellae]|uniref:Mannosyltransferase n=1 Tax=Cnuibacter physcomitrellae TaxID=1619308 RepID=A0A1X9LJJ9_9MICO|nr:glycosyltransferase family 1 protein [Cnuibacter physcomitrellae]ARJ05327.1 mannosyltransferase [Cnuibacter physcomitrellae]GGI35459.1 glycosyl transferase family 1 [Cnuibacter physcomitrellae]